MLIDFSQIKEMKIPGMNDGTGEMSARMYMDEQGKIIPTTIHPGGSIVIPYSKINYTVSLS